MTTPTPAPRKPWYRVLYLQVIIAVVLGIVVGRLFPAFGKSLKPLGDGFISLVKMMIAPIIFCTVVHGIASMSDLKKLGRVGAKTLIYFEVVSTIALLIGLLVVNVLKPGVGFTPPGETFRTETKTAADATATTHGFAEKAKALSTTEFILNIIPKTFLGAFVSGDLLQVLLVAILVAFAIAFMGERGKPLLHVIDYATQVFFGVMHIVVKAAPIGAFGAMGYTVGSYGIGALNKLLALMAGFYLTAGFFVVIVLGGIAAFAGLSIFRFLGHIKDELLLVLGTSSSETALPGMIEKMQRLGCAKSTVGLVIPTGYSFNLDGTNIYMTMAAVFLAQATNTPLGLGAQFSLLLIAMITSKGSSGVTGAGFVTLAATLQAVPSIPVEALALLVGIDRFMSECRALTNLVGNGVATVVISRWENEISAAQLQANLREPLTLAVEQGADGARHEVVAK
ncbi:C4-dicarboxylate transport protein 4 [Verrucomicrobiota bacterium]|nr:C4-dicarboxylate transport protein 4 [Verrucomicrobiota bacterium]